MARASIAKLCAAIALLFAAMPPANALITFKQPTWTELSPEQRTILAPLVNDWNSMESDRRKKWLGIAERYSAMTPEEKTRIQRRMKEWTRLSPEERKVARDGFTSLQNAPQEHRSAMKATIKQQWQQYQELQESEKQRLRNEPASRDQRIQNKIPASDINRSPASSKSQTR